MKNFNKLFLGLAVAAMAFSAVSCKDDEGGAGSSKDAFFFNETLAYNLTANPVINIPVVRLGTSGDVTVNVTATGSSNFKVASSVVIKDGDKVANIPVEYDKTSLTFNQIYNLTVSIEGFSSIYGFGKTDIVIEYPTSYFEYAKGTMLEDWWAEEEPGKVMYAREYLDNVYQCYVPDCWGHDSGPGYDVQDYVFFWNTATNKVYVPHQYMGYIYIADQGAWACRAAGDKHDVGSAAWFKCIDDWYAASGVAQPHYDPATKTFYLSDCYGDQNAASPTACNNDKYVME